MIINTFMGPVSATLFSFWPSFSLRRSDLVGNHQASGYSPVNGDLISSIVRSMSKWPFQFDTPKFAKPVEVTIRYVSPYTHPKESDLDFIVTNQSSLLAEELPKLDSAAQN